MMRRLAESVSTYSELTFGLMPVAGQEQSNLGRRQASAYV